MIVGMDEAQQLRELMLRGQWFEEYVFDKDGQPVSRRFLSREEADAATHGANEAFLTADPLIGCYDCDATPCACPPVSSYIACYYRYGGHYQSHHETLTAAIKFLSHGLIDGQCNPDVVHIPGGYVLGNEATMQLCWAVSP